VMDEMQCVAAVAQWCSAVKVNGCVARRREMQLVAWLAVYGGGNDHGWGGGGDWRNGSSEWKWMQNNGGSERENEREIKTLWPYMGPRLRCQDA